MAIVINDNLQNNSPKSLDNKYTKLVGSVSTAYASTTEANNAIPSAYRSIGLTVLINTGSGNMEYWYKDGITNPDLILKDLSYTLADNGLTKSGVTIKLGGTLLQDTTVNGGSSYTMLFTSSRAASIPTLEVANTGAGYGIYSHVVDGTGVYSTSTNGSAVSGVSTNGIGVSGSSTTIGGQFTNTSTTTNSVETSISLSRQTGTAAVGIGAAFNYSIEDDSGNTWQSNSLYSKWTNITHASRTSEFGITGTNAGSLVTHLTISGPGIFTLSQGLSNYANDAAAAGGGIPVNGLYRNGSVVMIRVS